MSPASTHSAANPFHEEAQRLLSRGYRGGQHSRSTTETDTQIVAMRVFDIDSSPECEPQPIPNEARLVAFEAARREAAGQKQVPF